MRPLRFTLSALLLTVLPIATASAALGTGSYLWAETTFTFTIAVLLFATLGAAFRRDDRRVFWAGFAVFGWAYWVLMFAPSFREHTRYEVVTSTLLSYLYPYWIPLAEKQAHYKDTALFFEFVGHSIFALFIGLAGGLVASMTLSRPWAEGASDAAER